MSLRLRNFLLLIGGFGFGQGAMFLAQSQLLIADRSSFLGQFGLIYAVTTLLYQIVDWGAVVVLARVVLTSVRLRDGPDVATAFWSLSCFRLVPAISAAAFGLVAAHISGHDFAIGYAAGSALGLILMAFNGGGLLDGLERSGWTGATAAFPAATSALVLVFASNRDPYSAGLILGCAYTAGTLIQVAGQWLLLERLGVRLNPVRPSAAIIWRLAHDGGLFLLSTLPGQLFFRGQLAISAVALGTSGVASFLYAKQLCNVTLQFLYFLRRVEFPNLVARVGNGTGALRTILHTQRLTLISGAIASAALACFGGGLWKFGAGALPQAAQAVIFLAPVVTCSGIFSIMNQGYAAVGRMKMAAATAATAMAIGLLLCAILVRWGVGGLAAAEGAANLIGAAVLAGGLLSSAADRRSQVASVR